MRSSLLSVLCVSLFAGCGSSGPPPPPEGIVIVGQIIRGGKPLELKNAEIGVETLEIAVVPADDRNAANTEYALASPDGSFRVEGPGRGVAPGKYRLAVFHRNDGVMSDGLNGAFSEKSSPIEFEISEDQVGGEFDLKTIDLDEVAKPSEDASEATEE